MFKLNYYFRISSFSYFIVILFIGIISCKKQEAQDHVHIEILSPRENSFYSLPDTIQAEILISSEKKPGYIKVTISNSQQIPVFAPLYFYPENNYTNLSFQYILENRDLTGEGQLYFQVSVATYSISNSYSKIFIESSPPEYGGFYVFTRPTVNESEVFYINKDKHKESVAKINGNFESSAVSQVHDMLFFRTKIPDIMYAFHGSDNSILWQIEPMADFPEFSSLSADGNKVFCGYGNGIIAGFSGVSGQQILSTPVMMDSVAEKLIIGNDFIIADIRVKNKPTRCLQVYYKSTGARFQRITSHTEVVDFYFENEQNELLIFGNEQSRGVVSHYYFEGNYFSNSLKIDENQIGSSCRVEESVFLFSAERKIFSINLKTLIKKQLIEVEDEIITIKYENTEQTVFVATENKVYFYSYPSMQAIDTFSFSATIKGIELRYAF